MNKYLINCYGFFIGDILFASSIAKKLKEQEPLCKVDYVVPLRQPVLLLRANPYIDTVFVGNELKDSDIRSYTQIFSIPLVNQEMPATIWFQTHCGIINPTTEYEVYTCKGYDEAAKKEIDARRDEFFNPNTIVVGYQVDWAWKAYQCTEETLSKGEGAPHRNMDRTIRELEQDFMMVPLGLHRSVGQYDNQANDQYSFAKMALIMKYCDYVIGSEGGITNTAAGIGTKTIITTDYIYQNYGANGRVRKCTPAMGPRAYFGWSHTYLNPCIKDEEIGTAIRNIILGYEITGNWII